MCVLYKMIQWRDYNGGFRILFFLFFYLYELIFYLHTACSLICFILRNNVTTFHITHRKSIDFSLFTYFQFVQDVQKFSNSFQWIYPKVAAALLFITHLHIFSSSIALLCPYLLSLVAYWCYYYQWLVLEILLSVL